MTKAAFQANPKVGDFFVRKSTAAYSNDKRFTLIRITSLTATHVTYVELIQKFDSLTNLTTANFNPRTRTILLSTFMTLRTESDTYYSAYSNFYAADPIHWDGYSSVIRARDNGLKTQIDTPDTTPGGKSIDFAPSVVAVRSAPATAVITLTDELYGQAYRLNRVIEEAEKAGVDRVRAIAEFLAAR